MQKLLVQKFLENHSLDELEKEHGVGASFSKCQTKFSLNYNQIESVDSDLLAQQCRGLILRKDNNTALGSSHNSVGATKIIAYPFDRFFNHGQGAAANVNWDETILFEKVDGTLCIIYFDELKDQWHVATRSVPEADMIIDYGRFTFRGLFEYALQKKYNASFEDLTKILNKYCTYMFELCTPFNRIVVEYNEPTIFFLGVRDKRSFQEFCPLDIPLLVDIPSPKTFNLSKIEDIIEYVNSRNPLEHEGLVVRDNNFRRIKIKNISYVAFNKARDVYGSSQRNCLELVLEEKVDDVSAVLPPEILDRIKKIQEGLANLIKETDIQYQKFVIETKSTNTDEGFQANRQRNKYFADLVAKSCAENKKIWSAPLFAVWRDKAKSTLDYIKSKQKNGRWPNGVLDDILDRIDCNL